MVENKGNPLEGRTLYIPRMSSGGSEAFAAAFRYLGIESEPTPEGDERTYELAGKCTSGDECLPARVTIGNLLRVIEQPGFDASKIAFFMPTAGGPCRFGQYSPFTQQVMEEMGHGEVMIVSPTSADGYASLGENAQAALKLCWWGLVASDALRKMLHIYRPYETVAGAADEAHAKSLKLFCDVLSDSSESLGKKVDSLAGAMEGARDIFRAVPADWNRDVMLVGVVGEIFCRLSTFSNEDLIRRLEPFGAQAWLSDITEWVHYTDSDNVRNLKRLGKTFSMSMLGALIKNRVQHGYERKLLAPLQNEFVGVEEPHDVQEVLDLAAPYLPVEGSHGEMVLSVGKSIYMYEKGADGIIDISPFTCMNGIVSEAVYPRVSTDHENIPIRNFYFDGTQTDLENDLGIFMELVRNYHRKKTRKRIRRNVA